MSDIPQALVEKGVGALYEHVEFSSQEGTAPLVRAILAAVWPDLPAARPVVDRGALAEVLSLELSRRMEEGDCDAPADEVADAILASGAVQSAADVRRAALDDLLQRADDGIEFGPESYSLLVRMVREVAREAAQR